MSTGVAAGGAPAAPAAPANGATNGAAPGAGTTNGAGAPQVNTSAPVAPLTGVEKLLKKLRVGGKEVEVDMAAPETAMELQRARHEAAQRRAFNEERGEFNRMLEQIKAGDTSVLKTLGLDVDGFMQRAFEERKQLEALTPEQQEVVSLKQELARRDAEQKRVQEGQQKEAQVAKKQALQKSTFNELMSAAKAAGMSLETRGERGAAMALAARLQMAAIKAGHGRLTPEQLGHEMEKATFGDLAHKLKAVGSNPAVRARRAAELKALREATMVGLDGDALLDALGPDLTAKIYAAGMHRLQKKNSQDGTPPVQEATPDGKTKVDSFAEARARYGFGR